MIYDLLKMSHTDLKDKFDIILVVSGFKAKYLKPAKFEQEIRVFSSIIRKSPVRLTIKQDIKSVDLRAICVLTFLRVLYY